MNLTWQPSITPEELAALPLGNDDHPVHADTTTGRYEIKYGPMLDGRYTYVLVYDGHRVTKRCFRTVHKAQRAAIEHLLSHGLRPENPEVNSPQGSTHVTGARSGPPMPVSSPKGSP